jgi:replicative DNA helicase
VQKNKIDILGIDGITYLTDERYNKGDTRTTMLTNISEDLMSLSIELKIPILVVVQSNRSGVNKDTDDTPDLENIKDSDGIAANATKVLAIKQKAAENIIQLSVRKHRDGRTGQTLLYQFDFDTGNFTYVPSNDDGLEPKQRKEKINKIKKEYNNDENVF